MLTFLRSIWCHDDDCEKESGCVSSMRTNNCCISFIQIFMRPADNLDRHKDLDEFEFWPDQMNDLGVTCPLVPKKKHIRHRLEHSLLSFNWKFRKLADNLDRHKISDFEFRPDGSIDFGVTCPLVTKKNNIFDIVWSIACLVLIGSLWNLQISWTCINSQTKWNSSKIALFP